MVKYKGSYSCNVCFCRENPLKLVCYQHLDLHLHTIILSNLHFPPSTVFSLYSVLYDLILGLAFGI